MAALASPPSTIHLLKARATQVAHRIPAFPLGPVAATVSPAANLSIPGHTQAMRSSQLVAVATRLEAAQHLCDRKQRSGPQRPTRRQ